MALIMSEFMLLKFVTLKCIIDYLVTLNCKGDLNRDIIMAPKIIVIIILEYNFLIHLSEKNFTWKCIAPLP